MRRKKERPSGSPSPPEAPVSSASLGEGARLVLEAATFIGGRGGGRLVYLVTQVLLGRFLAPFEFGLLALGLSVFRLIESLGSLGLQMAVVRFGADPASRKSGKARATVFKSVTLALAAGAVLGVGAITLAPSIAKGVFHKPEFVGILRIFALGFPLVTALVVAAAATRILRTARYAVVTRELGQPLLFLLLAVVALYLGLRAKGAAVAAVLSTGLAFLFAMALLLRLFPPSRKRVRAAVSSRALLSYSLPAAFSTTARFLVSWADRFVIGVLLPAASLGVYQAAAQLSAIFFVVLQGFAAMIGPILVELAATGERERARDLYLVGTKWTVLLTAPVAAVLLLAPRATLQVSFGTHYVKAWPILVVLAIGQLISLSGGSLGALLSMTGHERAWAIVAGTGFVLNLVLNYLLIPRWGLFGASVATVVTLTLLTGVGAWLAKGVLGRWPIDRSVLKALAIGAVSLAACWLLIPQMPAGEIARIVTLLLCATSSVVLMMVLSGLGDDERELLRMVRKKVAGR